MTRLKFCAPLSHVPFHLVGTGPRPSSSELFLSGHIRVSIVPTMISLPYVVYCDHNLEEEERPRESGKCVVVRSETAWFHGLEGVNKVSLSAIIILSSTQNGRERKRYECEKVKKGFRHGGKNIREYLVYGSMNTRGSFIRAGRGS
ncbi:hypothetical protein SUGI_0573440 [Cryptomeria japonica]|nr:hypothetical protein SUGI_0573440 [Cryptomeria japonica]